MHQWKLARSNRHGSIRGAARAVVVPFLPFLLVGLALWASGEAARADTETTWNQSPDPNALYGRCMSGGSALGNKWGAVYGVGEPSAGVIAIKVLRCGPFSGGGPRKVACPDDSPYAYCTRIGNDGLANDVTFGVVRQDAKTDPNAVVGGCPGGKPGAAKLDIVKSARKDPRRLSGIVTLACTDSVASKAQRAHRGAAESPCPVKPNPYRYCVTTDDDGTGHAVTVGVVGVNGPGDPYGLYGECNQRDTAPGFSAKSALLTQLGLTLEGVRSIDMMFCNIPVGFGGDWPLDLHSGSCKEVVWVPPWLRNYDYCVWGTDERNNGVLMGVGLR